MNVHKNYKDNEDTNSLKKSQTTDICATEALDDGDGQYKKKISNISYREFDRERLELIYHAIRRR